MKRLLALTLSLALAGCSQFARQPAPPQGFNPASAAQLHTWQAEGRIGIRMANESHSANLDWWQQQDEYRIALTGPLGQGGLRIEGDNTGVSLRQSGDDQVYRASSPEALMQKLLGWHLPLSQARFWIRGLADPRSPSTPLADPAIGFTQAGWRVEYMRFSTQAGQTLPEKLRLQHEDLRLTVILSRWET